MKDFGIKLRDVRIKNNESQKDLADYLNVSFQSISKWEQGVHYPDVFTINKLAEHYKVRTDYFFGTQNKPTDTESFPVSVNKVDTICVWTDFLYNGTIAPTAMLDDKRHRSGNGELNTSWSEGHNCFGG
jgi:transcriptional regulator with XRE-family HTH domain